MHFDGNYNIFTFLFTDDSIQYITWQYKNTNMGETYHTLLTKRFLDIR